MKVYSKNQIQLDLRRTVGKRNGGSTKFKNCLWGICVKPNTSVKDSFVSFDSDSWNVAKKNKTRWYNNCRNENRSMGLVPHSLTMRTRVQIMQQKRKQPKNCYGWDMFSHCDTFFLELKCQSLMQMKTKKLRLKQCEIVPWWRRTRWAPCCQLQCQFKPSRRKEDNLKV